MSSENVNRIFSQSYQTQQILNIMKNGGPIYTQKADSALSNKIDKDTLVKSGCSDGKDDGKISTGEKIKNFAKGLVAPITTMFKSPKNFLIGAGAIAATTALVVGTGGAAAPFLVAAGAIGGGVQIGVNAYKAKNAETDLQAKQAWQGMGTGTTAVAASVAGAKGALKATGTDTSKMGAIKATFECIKQAPSSIKNSIGAVKSGAFISNIKGAFKINKKQSASADESSAQDIQKEAQRRTQQEAAAERKADISQEAYKQSFEKDLSHKSAKESAEVIQQSLDKQVQQEAQARIQQKAAAERKADISQEAYKQSFEKDLSHKSAKESAEVIQQSLAEAQARADATPQAGTQTDINETLIQQSRELAEKAAEMAKIAEEAPDPAVIAQEFIEKNGQILADESPKITGQKPIIEQNTAKSTDIAADSAVTENCLPLTDDPAKGKDHILSWNAIKKFLKLGE